MCRNLVHRQLCSIGTRTATTMIDLVITWVNGADPRWRAKRQAAGLETALETANVEGRFRDNGELRYLLRSIEQFWPFDGMIYLVTDEQVPDFLSGSSRVKIIDHREILDEQYLPTFSSRAIESALHRIPQLSEHFVAFNDDVMLARPVLREDFFGRLGCMVYLTEEKLPLGNCEQAFSGHNDALNARNWMLAHKGLSSIDRLAEHSPKGIRKSWMLALEEEHPELFHQTRAEQVRQPHGQSILSNLYGDWCLSQGRGEIRVNQCEYRFSCELESDPHAAESLRSALGHKLSICINDTSDNRHDVSGIQRQYSDILGQLFSQPSVFEQCA
jgi:hypothetical protein